MQIINKQQYLEFVKNWKSLYKNVSQRTRLTRFMDKNEARLTRCPWNLGIGSNPTDEQVSSERNRLHKLIEVQQQEIDRLSVVIKEGAIPGFVVGRFENLATALLGLRKEMKIEAGKRYLAEKENRTAA